MNIFGLNIHNIKNCIIGNSMFYTLWIGNKLPNFQKMCLSSFVNSGFSLSIFCYDNVHNLPEGVNVLDANVIIPEKNIFIKQTALGLSYSQFSDIFRYRMLEMVPNSIWVDTDIFCLSNNWKGYLEKQYIFASNDKNDKKSLTGSILKVDSNSDILKSFIFKGEKMSEHEIHWEEVGPKLVSEEVERHSLQDYIIKRKDVLSPEKDIECLLEPSLLRNTLSSIDKDQKMAIIFWNSYMRSIGIDLEADSVKRGSFLYYLFKKYEKWSK